MYGKCRKDFEIGQEIGHGASGTVYQAKCLQAGFMKDVAIKKIAKNKCKNEINIHKSIPNNLHFVDFYTSFEENEYCYLVMELCTGGSLGDYLKCKKCLPEAEAAQLIYQVFEGLSVLHNRSIVHRDLSLRNLLLTKSKDKGLQVKIADFGLAVALKYQDEKISTINQVGTANFMAPEVVNQDPYNYKADLWSAGCVLYALLFGSPPFSGKTKKDIVQNIKKCEVKFPEYATKEAKHLLKSLLKKNPEERIEYPKILKHPFFQKYGLADQDKKQESSGYSSSTNSSSKSQLIHTFSYSSDQYKSKKGELNTNKNFPGSNINFSDNTGFRSQSHQVISKKHLSNDAPLQERYSKEIKTYMDERNTFDKENDVSLLNTVRKNYSQNEYENNGGVVNYKHNGDSGMSSLLKSHSTYTSSCASSYPRSLGINGSLSNLFLNTNKCHQNTSQMQIFDHAQFQDRQVKESKNHVSVPNTVAKSLKDIKPLNTVRLSAERKEIQKGKENFVISILSDGKVCFESLKSKKGKKYVNIFYLISDDGLKIQVYKPKKKILLNQDHPPPFSHEKNKVQYFSFGNLPKQEGEFFHWRNYNYAKQYIELFRAHTPKVTVYGKIAVCKMMENTPNPNYKMLFYDCKHNGFEIIEKNGQLTIKDERGCIVPKKDWSTSMLEEFEHMKQRCKKFENIIEADPEIDFPVKIGKKKQNSSKKADISKKTMIPDNDKENLPHPVSQSQLFNAVDIDVPIHQITIDPDPSSTPNVFQKRTSASCLGVMNTNLTNTNSSWNINNYIPNLKNLEVAPKWIIARYNDGIEMFLSKESNEAYFKYANRKEYISARQCPELKDRFEKDSLHILRSAMQIIESKS